jgi:hypothetical protein
VRRRNLAGALAGALVLAGALGSGAACSKAKTPEQAQTRLCKAVTAGDPAALFEALDTQTRWDWMTVQKSHREAYDIILSNYPEGAERDRELRRFERGATLGSGRALFAEEAGGPPWVKPGCGTRARRARASSLAPTRATRPSSPPLARAPRCCSAPRRPGAIRRWPRTPRTAVAAPWPTSIRSASTPLTTSGRRPAADAERHEAPTARANGYPFY